MVDRYAIDIAACQEERGTCWADMRWFGKGEYVKYSDYAKLEQALRECVSCLRMVRGELVADVMWDAADETIKQAEELL